MKLLALTSLVVLLPVGAHADGGPTTPVQVENAIRHHIASLRAVEYPEARKVTAVEGTTVASKSICILIVAFRCCSIARLRVSYV